jgi:hypothetical protein
MPQIEEISMDFEREPGAAKRSLAVRLEEDARREFVPQVQNYGWVPPGMRPQLLHDDQSLAERYNAWALNPSTDHEMIEHGSHDVPPPPDDDDL